MATDPEVPMPDTRAPGDLTTDRPTQQPQNSTSSRPARRPAAAAGESARRRWRVESALAAGQLSIRSERDGPTHTVAVFGELDVVTAQLLDDELKAVEATNVQQIVLDLAGLTFMDSSGVHLIAGAEARCGAAAKRLALLRHAPRIQRVFELAAVDVRPLPHKSVVTRGC